MSAFLILACTTLAALILELIWGAQWRWLATTALVGVVLSVIVPFATARVRPALTLAIAPDLADPHPSSPPPTPPVTDPPQPQRPGAHPATWSVGQLAPPPDYFRSWQSTPLPTGSAVEVKPEAEPVAAPEPPKPFSPVAPPPDETLRWPRPGQSS